MVYINSKPNGVMVEMFISGVLYGQEMEMSSFTITRRVGQNGRDLKIW
jgi:hypothetical protein